MVDINSTLPIIEPITLTIENLMDFIKYLVGGIFGIYVISFFINLYYQKKFHQRLKKIETAVQELKVQITELSKRKRK